ncbi:MAG: PLP-dependent aminotransferase family protein, partial [Pseudomonadales bacterium]
ISFAGGAPAPEFYPIDNFRKASDRAFEEVGRNILAYDGAYGIEPLRTQIAEQRMASAGVSATADNIRILSGSQQGIDFAARLFIDEGDVVICEDPTYLGALNSFDFYRPQYVAVPIDNQGMIMEDLEKALAAHPEAKLIYTVPDFQNPSGISMSAARRKRMVELATQYDVVIVEDSPYYEIRFEGENIPAVKSFDKTGDTVIYLGSFSKSLSPGVRLGWICASAELLDKYRVQKEASDFQASTVSQWQVSTYLRDYDLSTHIEYLRDAYRTRRDVALEMVKEHFPDNIRYTLPEGGFFIWLTLPEHVDTTELFPRAVNECGVAYVPGESFFAQTKHKNNIRLSYSQMAEEKTREGMKRLAGLLGSL